jgi:ParB family chromosome partitioning protein
VIARGLSVRETEALVKRMAAASPATTAARAAVPEETKDVHTRAAEDRMRFALGAKVRISRRGTGGRIEIDFATEDELNRLFELIVDRR